MLSNSSQVLGFFALLTYDMLVSARTGSYMNYTASVSSAPSSTSTSNSSVKSTDTRGPCSLLGATLQILYFPPESEILNKSAPVSTVATTLVSDNFTFTSPSIYVIYNTLAAVALGPPHYDTQTTVGDVYYSLTRAYPPNYLSTLPQGCYHGFGEYRPLNTQDFISPQQNWQVESRCAKYFTFQESSYGGPNGTLMALSPLMSIPPDISTYNPAWKGCFGNGPYNPAWDPPRVLTPVSALMGETTTLDATVPSSIAKPHARPSEPQATPTVAVSSRSTSRSQTVAAHPASQITDPSPSIQPIHSPHQLNSADRPVSMIADPWHDPISLPLQSAVPARPTLADLADPKIATSESKNPQTRVALIPVSTPVATQQGHTIFGSYDGGVIVDESALKSGDAAMTIDGLSISVGASAVHIGQSSFALPASKIVSALRSISGNAIYAIPSGGVGIGSATVMPGQQTTIDGKAISVSSERVVVDGSTYALQSPGMAATGVSSSLPELGGESISVLPNGGIAIGGSTVSVNGIATISGTTVSLDANVVAIDGKTYALPTPTRDGPKIGQQIIKTASDGAIVVGSVTVSNHAQTTISGTPISVGNGFIVVAGSTYSWPETSDAPTQNDPKIGQQMISSASGGAIVVGSVTVSKQAQTTISGTPVSVGSDFVVVAGSTYPWPGASDAPTRGQNGPKIGQQTIRTASDEAVVIGSITLSQGTQTKISGTPISVGSDFIVVAGSTYPRPSAPNTPSQSSTDPIPIERISGSDIIFDGLTLSPGAQTTVSGTSISVGRTEVVVNGVTHTVPATAASSSEPGLGAVIASMFDFDPSAETTRVAGTVASATSTESLEGALDTKSRSSMYTPGPTNTDSASFGSGASRSKIHMWELGLGLLGHWGLVHMVFGSSYGWP